MNNFDDFYTLFCKEVSAVCHTYVRMMVMRYFEIHNYDQCCHFWDTLNENARNICADLNPHTDPRYVSISELRKKLSA